jgi:hypothetical protein
MLLDFPPGDESHQQSPQDNDGHNEAQQAQDLVKAVN